MKCLCKCHEPYPHWDAEVCCEECTDSLVDEPWPVQDRFFKKIYDMGMRRVAENPPPPGQKFPVGSFVEIHRGCPKDVPHKCEERPARVKFVYSHAFPQNSPNIKSYCLLVRFEPGEWAWQAWYYEDELKPMTDIDKIEAYKWEIKCSTWNTASSNLVD